MLISSPSPRPPLLDHHHRHLSGDLTTVLPISSRSVNSTLSTLYTASDEIFRDRLNPSKEEEPAEAATAAADDEAGGVDRLVRRELCSIAT